MSAHSKLVFQLTASRRGWRRYYRTLSIHGTYFNSQPHEEADFYVRKLVNRINYFNSQPHEEADGKISDQSNFLYISTHSLTKRLTLYVILSYWSDIFQLTASRRGWLDPWGTFEIDGGISTHSLTKRLTECHSPHMFCCVISTHSLTKRLT